MSINLVQWEGSTVTPKLDAIMYDDGSYGIIKGCAITHQGTNLLKIANGFIKIAGRLIEIAEETIQCQVSSSGTVNGQLWIRLDLGAVTPVSFMSEAAAVLTPLTQNEDCNFENGIYELQLATYNIDESVITNLVETAPELEKLRTALDNIDLSANKVTYDNTHSGMTATKVQGAIDEINDNLTTLDSKVSYQSTDISTTTKYTDVENLITSSLADNKCPYIIAEFNLSGNIHHGVRVEYVRSGFGSINNYGFAKALDNSSVFTMEVTTTETIARIGSTRMTFTNAKLYY